MAEMTTAASEKPPKKGGISAAELKKIKAKADRILTRGKLKKAPPPPAGDADMDQDAASDIDADGM